MSKAIAHYTLDEKEFKKMVTGKVVPIPVGQGKHIEIALQDIGYNLMIEIINEGIANMRSNGGTGN
jgi:hypothetical protein